MRPALSTALAHVGDPVLALLGELVVMFAKAVADRAATSAHPGAEFRNVVAAGVPTGLRGDERSGAEERGERERDGQGR